MDDLFQLEESPNLCRSTSRLGLLLVRLLSTCTRLKLPETAPLFLVRVPVASSDSPLQSDIYVTLEAVWPRGRLAVWPFGCVEKGDGVAHLSALCKAVRP